jgi:group I intron endonuclease
MSKTEHEECEVIGKTPTKNENQALSNITQKKIVGIYGLKNKITGKWYIGQSTNILRRFRDYKTLRCKKQPNIYFAIIKYGFDSFEKIILEECESADWILDYREIYWIKFYDSFLNGYNLTEGGKTNLNKQFGGKKMSAKHRESIRLGQLGRKHPQETIEKMSNSAKSRWESANGFEMKKKLSKIQTGRRKLLEHVEKTSGSNNGQYGKHWITNELDNKTIFIQDPIPSGWKKGRKINHITSEKTRKK